MSELMGQVTSFVGQFPAVVAAASAQQAISDGNGAAQRLVELCAFMFDGMWRIALRDFAMGTNPMSEDDRDRLVEMIDKSLEELEKARLEREPLEYVEKLANLLRSMRRDAMRLFGAPDPEKLSQARRLSESDELLDLRTFVNGLQGHSA